MSVEPITARQAGEFARLLEEREVGGDEFQTLFVEGIENVMAWRNGGKVTEDVVELSSPRPATEEYSLVIDHGMAIEELVRLGEYDSVNKNITSRNFPTTRTGEEETTAILVHFDRDIESDDAVKELDAIGLRPAEADETLAFGKQYPDKQRKFPIVGLGSVVQLSGVRYVLYLAGWDGKRGANLRYWDGRWGCDYRFLAFRK